MLGRGKLLSFFFLGGGGGGAESERNACRYFFTDSVLGRGKLCPFFLGRGAESERSAGISLRIQCLGGGNCVLFFFWGERSLSGVLVFLYGFSAWEGKTVYFFFGGERSLSGVLVFLYQIQCLGGENCVLFVFFWGGAESVRSAGIFFADSVLGRGKLCPFFGGEQGLSGVLVFLYGFSAWEGKTVSFFLGGERSLSGVLVCLYGFSAWEGKTVSFFFGGRGSGV